MNLEDIYKKTKDSKSNKLSINCLAAVLTVGLFLIFLYIFNLGWNFIAPIWNLPILSYSNFLVSWVILRLLSMTVFGFTVNARDYKMISFDGDNPYGKK